MTSRNVRRTGDTPTVSLFPFLAVLLCTMGMLVMLLVLISKGAAQRDEIETMAANVITQNELEPASENIPENISDTKNETLVQNVHSDSPTESPSKLTLDEARDKLETTSWFRDELLTVREKTITSLKAERDRLARAEAAVADSIRELKQLKVDLSLLADNSSKNDDSTYQNITLEKEKLQRLTDEIEELQKQKQSGGNRYAIIPYRGKNGTYRQPLYIECTEGGVFLMPEGIPFDITDFLLAKYPGNPFDTALRTARTWTMNKTNDDSSEPYPLVIVRPGGADKYYAVVEALASWGGDYGYEFVEEDWKLDYPPADPQLKTEIDNQVALARYRLAVPLATMTAELEREMQQEQTPRSSYGQAGTTTNTGALAQQLGGNVRLPSTNDGIALPQYTGQFRGNGNNAVSHSASPQSGNGFGNENANNFANNLMTSNSAPQEPFSLPNENNRLLPGPMNSNNMMDSSLMNANLESGSSPSTPLEVTGTASTSTQQSIPSLIPNQSPSDSQTVSNSILSNTQTSDSSLPSDPRNQLASMVQNESSTTSTTAASSNKTPENRWETVGNTTYMQGANPEVKDGANLVAATDSSVSSGRVAPPTKKDKEQDKKELPKKETPDPYDGKAIHIAETLTQPVNSLVERPIRVVCLTDRLVFPKQPGLRQEQTIMLQENAEKEVLETIALCVKSWGVAGRNMYWTPWLSVSIPDEKAQPQFVALKSFIEPQGVAVRGSTTGQNLK